MHLGGVDTSLKVTAAMEQKVIDLSVRSKGFPCEHCPIAHFHPNRCHPTSMWPVYELAKTVGLRTQAIQS